MKKINHKVDQMSELHSHTMTYLSFLETTVDLPEVFGEEIFSDWLPVDSDSLSDLDQVR